MKGWAMKKIALALVVVLFGSVAANAAIIDFNLQGNAGFGLLGGNENGLVTNPGSGGEVGAGITFNDATLSLTINVAWGSANGFANLSSPVIDMHIHGIALNPAPASFSENSSVIIGLTGLPGYNTSLSAGGNSGTVTLSAAQATALQEGRLYLNVHTQNNSGGEIRGNMVPVPEPASAVLLAAGIIGLLARRKYARAQ
jgi:hypothetical protein